MLLPSLLAFVIGLLTVLQSGLNKKISMIGGLPAAVAINSTVIFVIAILFYIAQKYGWIPFPESLRSESLFQFQKWWLVIPALCGFMIVLGFPLAITYTGAAQVFVIAIAGQCLGAMLWDFYIEHNAPTLLRSLGVLLTFLGAFLVSFK